MAKKFIEYLVDDMTGAELAPGDGETVRFGFEGVAYEIDLAHDTAATLAAFLAPYVKAARRDTGTPKAAPKKAHRPADEARNARIREWAAGEGIELPARGRIPAEVVKAYNAANADAK